jgi:SHAQKYF class myb-like DNA-binding protein
VCMDFATAKIVKPATTFIPKARKQYTIQRKREKWTKEEHKRFMEAIEKFGRNWKKVEEYVSSKSRKQIRSHAQKHFDKMKKTGANFPPPRAKRKAQHPYPSRRTTEMFAVYAKQMQQQQLQLQFQVIPKCENEPEPNHEHIKAFLASLFIPSKYNLSDIIKLLSPVDKKHIRVLMHNLAVILSKEQTPQQEKLLIPIQQQPVFLLPQQIMFEPIPNGQFIPPLPQIEVDPLNTMSNFQPITLSNDMMLPGMQLLSHEILDFQQEQILPVLSME